MSAHSSIDSRIVNVVMIVQIRIRCRQREEERLIVGHERNVAAAYLRSLQHKSQCVCVLYVKLVIKVEPIPS